MAIRRGLRFAVCCILALSLLAISETATGAQQRVQLTINEIDSSSFPLVRAAITVTDVTGLPVRGIPIEAFSVSEAGRPVTDFTVAETTTTDRQLNVVLAIDTSESMYSPLPDTQAAALSFINALADDDRVGLVTFSDTADEALPLTDDLPSAAAAIEALEASGRTAMYDAVVASVQMLKNLPAGHKAVILIADGYDTGSRYTFEETVNEAVRWSIPVYPIGFGSVDRNAMEKLAELTGGHAQIRPDAAALQSAFDTVLEMLRFQYALEYTSVLPADNQEYGLVVTVDFEGYQLQDTVSFVAYPEQIIFELENLTDGQEIGGTVSLQPVPASIASRAPVQQVEYALDGELLQTIYEAPFEFVWDSTAVADGSHTLTATATDAAGNVGRVEMALVVRRPIIVDWLTPVDGTEVSKSGPLQVNVDSIAGISKVDFFVNDTLLGTAVTEPYAVEWPLDSVEPGSYTLRAVATDTIGQTAEASIAVRVLLRRNTTLIALAVIALIALAAVVIPFAIRRRSRLSKSGADAQAALMLVELQGKQPGHAWPLGPGEIRIGRKQDANDIPAAGRSASRQHAIIRIEDGECMLHNLNPQNPTIVNGQPVYDVVALAVDDTLQIGESVFRLEPASRNRGEA